MIRQGIFAAALAAALPLVAANATVAQEDALSATIGTDRKHIELPTRAKIALDRANATYRCGEEATFTVTVAETNGVKYKSGTVTWKLDNYGSHKFAEGTVDLAKQSSFTVKGTLPYPGFLRLTVRNGKGVKYFHRCYSAAYEPEKIRTGVPKPADFDRFWDEAMARLEREVPIDVQIEPVPSLSKNGLSVNRISFATFGGRVYGGLSSPTDAKSGPYPARVHCPGAGPGFLIGNCIGDRGHVVLHMSVHGFPVPESDAERKALYDAQEAKYRKLYGPNAARAYPVAGMTVSREAVHYFPIILGINRAVNWLAAQSYVDKRRITYSGASQGGGFGLYLAGLNKNITKAYMGVPALADLMGFKMDGRQSGWPRVIEHETQKDPARFAMMEKIAPYFDGAYFAERIRIPVRLSVGYADESCAPQAVLATYNAISSQDKKLYHGIGGVHGSPNAPMKEVNTWLETPMTEQMAAPVEVQALSNPSFEEIKDGRPVGWRTTNKSIRAERGVGHNGSGGVVWESKEPAAGQSACLTEVEVGRGVPYQFSCLVQTDRFEPGRRGTASICMEWYDANGKWMGGGYSKRFEDRKTDWIEIGGVTREIPFEAKTVRVQVYVSKGAKGRVAFDNVTVRPVKRAPVAFVFSSAYRDTAVSGPVRFHAALYPGRDVAAADLEAEFSYLGADGAEVRTKPTEFTADGATLALKVEDLARGTHPVACVLSRKGGEKLGSAVCEFTRAMSLPPRRVWIDEHQRCLVDGKPFFPLGMYWGQVEAEKLAKYAEGPFNCLMPYARATRQHLDLCQAKGLMAFVNLKNETLHSPWARRKKITTQAEVDAFFEAEINKVKDHPALLAWYVNDEAPVTEVPERTHLYSLFRRIDPNHPTWAVLDRLHDLREFIPTYDVLGMDPYPVAQKPLTHITEFIRGTQKAIFNDRPLWNVPQTFNWGWYRKHLADKERFPTEQEMKNMNWQHIALGANGLISYCYHALYRDVKPENFDNYWKPICNAAAEVKKMMPVLLSVEEAPAAQGAPEMVPVRTWMKDGELYVLAVNARNEVQTANLALSRGAWAVAGCEIGVAGRLSAPDRLVIELPPLGVSFMRLRAVR